MTERVMEERQGKLLQSGQHNPPTNTETWRRPASNTASTTTHRTGKFLHGNCNQGQAYKPTSQERQLKEKRHNSVQNRSTGVSALMSSDTKSIEQVAVTTASSRHNVLLNFSSILLPKMCFPNILYARLFRRKPIALVCF